MAPSMKQYSSPLRSATYSVSRSKSGKGSPLSSSMVASQSAREATRRARSSRRLASVGTWVKPPTVMEMGWVWRPQMAAHRSPASCFIRSARSTTSGALLASGMTLPTPR